MKSIWNVDYIVVNDGMRMAFDNYVRAKKSNIREFAADRLIHHISQYLIDVEKEEKESLENGRK